jgi:hypothetical protein
MATLALAVAGSAIGSSLGGAILGVSAATLGGFVGASVGSLIDSQLFPAPGRTIEGPRLGDLAVQSSAYGAPIALPYGTVRLAGNVIWSTGLIETRQENTTTVKGGKGIASKQKVTQVSYTYSASFAVAIAGREIFDIGRIWADGKLLREAGGALSTGGLLRIYKGDEGQLPDPLIEAVEGAGNVPAHRGLAYVVFEDLELAEFANRIPNLTFEVIAETGGVAVLGDIVADLAARAGLDALDASALTQSVRGFVVPRAMPARAALEALGRAFQFDAAEVDGIVLFQKKPVATTTTIDPGDLGAAPANSPAGEALILQRAQELELAREVALHYIDPGRDYQPNVQRARRLTSASPTITALESPLVLSAAEAKQAAEITLSQHWIGRESARFSLPTKYLALAPGDVVALATNGVSRQIRLERIEAGAAIHCEGVTQSPAAYVSSAPAESGGFAGQTVADFGVTTLVLANLPALTSAHAITPVFYAAVAGDTAGWRGAALYVSSDGGLSYALLTTAIAPAVMGSVASPPGDGPSAFWDNGNSLSVSLLLADMELESRPALSVLNGANAALVGNEIIQFRSAVLEADGSYTLSGLLRGRRGTEWAIAGHGAGERFVLLEEATLIALDTDLGAIAKPYDYKALSENQSLAEVAAQSFTYGAENLRPFSPVDARGARDGAQNLSVTWKRRTRSGGEWTDGTDVPLGEASERYAIDILDGAAVVRTIETTAPTLSYSAAEQTADFGAPQSAIALRIYQISDSVGRGRPLDATV